MPDDKDSSKRRLSVFEKLAIIIIIILVVLIMLLIFNEQIKEYIEIFKAWYGNA
jgi:hypothetical protein